jgi:undecaprenyl phosphate-alpha-L-ara4N flippase subunit ArnF
VPATVTVLLIVTILTLIGDYFLKVATGKSEGIASGWFAAGVVTYGILAFGWFVLMKSNSLAAIGVMFSASTILLLSALGYFVFKEQFGLREALGVSLAVLSVVVMNSK